MIEKTRIELETINDDVLELERKDGSAARVWIPCDARTMLHVLWLEANGVDSDSLTPDSLDRYQFAMSPVLSRMINR